MLSRTGRVLITACRCAVQSRRNLTVTPVAYKAAAASDPIQQLFVDKVQAYAQKSKASGGKLVDATPEVEARFQADVDRVQKQYGVATGEDVTKFPTFNFQDTELEPVGVSVDAKAESVDEVVDEVEVDDSPFFDV